MKRTLVTFFVGACTACGAQPSAKPLGPQSPTPRTPPQIETVRPVAAPVDAYFVSGNLQRTVLQFRELLGSLIPGADVDLARATSRSLGVDVGSLVDWAGPGGAAIADLDSTTEGVFGMTLIEFDKTVAVLSELGVRMDRRGSRQLIEFGEGVKCELWPRGLVPTPMAFCTSSDKLQIQSYALGLGEELATAKLRNDDVFIRLHGTWRTITSDVTKTITTGSAAEVEGVKLARAFLEGFETPGVGVTRKDDRFVVHADAVLAAKRLGLIDAFVGRSREPLPGQLFERLPSDAGLAFVTSGSAPGAARAEILSAMRVSLAGEPSSRFDQRGTESTAEAFADAVFTGGPWAVAQGLDIDASIQALRANEHEPSKAYEQLQKVEKFWTAIGVTDPEATFVPRLRRAYEIGTRYYAPNAQAVATAASTSGMPFGDNERSTDVTAVLPLPSGHGLPDGSMHFINRTVVNPKFVVPPGELPALAVKQHVFVAPQAGQAWMVISTDETTALRRLREILAPKKNAKKPPALVLDGSASCAGYLHVDAAPLIGDPSTLQEVESLTRTLAAIRRLPREAEEPISFHCYLQDDSTTGSATMRVEADVKEAVLVPALFQLLDQSNDQEDPTAAPAR